MALDQLYQQVVLDHNRSPHHFGRLNNATHEARGHDALCGDDILIELRVEGGQIEAASFSGEACAITKASASMLMDWLIGKAETDVAIQYRRFSDLLEDSDLPDAPSLGDMNHLRAVGGFPARVRNARLPWRTVLRALGQAPRV